MRKGELHSAESRAKISASKAGKRFTEEHVEAIRKALAGRPKSPSHRKAIAEGIRSARLARQQMPIIAQPIQSMKVASNQKRTFRATTHYTDKPADLNDLNRAVDTYADWKIKAYQRQQHDTIPQESVKTDIEEDW